jgi:SulP family sulfate permease
MSIMTYILVLAPLAIVYFLPYITNAVPATLVATFSLTAVVLLFGIDVQNVGNLGTISQTLPTFLIPDAPFNFETLKIIFPTALALSIIGLLESLLTASIIDDMTETASDKNKRLAAKVLLILVPASSVVWQVVR